MECSSISQMKYAQFSLRLQGKVSSKRIPISGTLEITSNCNLKCVHCYVVPNKRGNELSTKEVFRLFDELAVEGCLWLLITGGEPLVRPDFEKIYVRAKEKGFLITLFTNATLISPRIADLLQEFPPFSIETSIYGASKETYERVTKVKDSFEKFLHGVNLLLERSLPLKLKTMILNFNKQELPAIKAFANDIKAD